MTWLIKFDDPCVEDLSRSFEGGRIIKLAEEVDCGREEVFIQKGRFGQFGGLSVHIYADEHPPPHFHVKCNGEENSFRIDDGEPLYPDGDLSGYFKNVKKWHRANKERLISYWNQCRPSDCPVGAI